MDYKLAQYVLYFCFCYRLHDSSEKILDDSNDQDARSRRKRRHHLRIFLLVLDYLVECLGGIFIFIVIFVADKSLLQQHIMLTIGSFVYGVPIPLAYLLNETRVRNIIIQNGWLQGVKSIFHSSERIKQLERDKIVKCFHYEKLLIRQNEPPIKICKVTMRNLQGRASDVVDLDNVLTDCHVIEIDHNEQKGTPDDSASLKNDEGESIPLVCSDVQPSDGVVIPVEVETGTVPKPRLNCNGEGPSSVRKDLNEVVNAKFCILEYQEDAIQVKLLMDMDAALIDSVFFEQSNEVISLLSDFNFKVFSRSYILKNTLKLLNDNGNESDYRKYFKHICDLECYTDSQDDNDKKMHLLMSLINAWHLRKYQNIPEGQNTANSEIQVRERLGSNNIADDQGFHERKRILDLLLCNVNCDEEYKRLLDELYMIEEEQKVDELVYGW